MHISLLTEQVLLDGLQMRMRDLRRCCIGRSWWIPGRKTINLPLVALKSRLASLHEASPLQSHLPVGIDCASMFSWLMRDSTLGSR